MTTPILSPCIGICHVNDHGVCEGCFRTLHEIGTWLQFSPAQREYIMESILPEREASS